MSNRRYEKMVFSCAADLERNRLVTVTKSTGAAVYSTYGDVVDGWLDTRAENNRAGVISIDQLWSNMQLKLQTAVIAKGDPVFAGANGQVCGTLSYTVISKTGPYTQPAGSNGDKYIAPANVTAWTSPTQCVAGEIIEKGASVYTRTAAIAGMVVYVTDEKRYYICSAANTWVVAEIVGYAGETGAAGEEIEIYRTRAAAKPSTSRFAIVAMGQSTSETDSDATITIVDERIVSGDIAFVTPLSGATGASLPIEKAVCTANTLTVTLSGNGGAATVLNYMIVRAVA